MDRGYNRSGDRIVYCLLAMESTTGLLLTVSEVATINEMGTRVMALEETVKKMSEVIEKQHSQINYLTALQPVILDRTSVLRERISGLEDAYSARKNTEADVL